MAQTCHTLDPVVKQYIDFDPNNPEHLEAFRLLCLGDTYRSPIRQHETLRFNLEPPFLNVRTMMFHKVSEAHIKLIKG